MMKKYEFTGETKMWLGRELHRIRAVRDFGDVKKGDLGGWIEKKDNLSHEGNCFVYGDALVYGNAVVCGNAKVYGNADISKTSDYICIGPIGSRNDYTTFFRSKDKKIMVACGCSRGDIDEFEAKVQKTHEESKHESTYMKACELARLQI